MAATGYSQHFLNICASGPWQAVANAMMMGSKIHWTDTDGYSALHYAILNNNIDVAEQLLEEVPGRDKIDVNARAKNGWTPLQIACLFSYPAAVDLLLERGAYVMAMDLEMNTPLHVASVRGDTQVVERLVRRHHVDVNAVNKFSVSPFYCSLVYRNTQVAEILLNNGADVNQKTIVGVHSLHIHSIIEPLDIMEKVLQRSSEVNAANIIGNTPLHCAYYYNCVQAAERLIENGACVNSTNNEGHTPLHTSASTGGASLSRLLLKSGANVDAVDNVGNTALFIAARFGHMGHLKVLFEHGVDLSLASKSMTDLCMLMRNDPKSLSAILEIFIKHMNSRLTVKGFYNFFLSSFASQFILLNEKLKYLSVFFGADIGLDMYSPY